MATLVLTGFAICLFLKLLEKEHALLIAQVVEASFSEKSLSTRYELLDHGDSCSSFHQYLTEDEQKLVSNVLAFQENLRNTLA